MVLQDEILGDVISTQALSLHHHPQVPHTFPGPSGLCYHSLPCSRDHLTGEQGLNGNFSCRRGQRGGKRTRGESSQCNSETSRCGYSSSPESAIFSFTCSHPHLFSTPLPSLQRINGNCVLIMRENRNILSQRDRKVPVIVYVMLLV